MAVNQETLKKKLEQFKASKKGEKLIEEAKINAIKNGNKLSPTLNSYKQLGDLFMKELSNTINADGRSSDALKEIGLKLVNNKGNYTVSNPELIKGRQFKISINFDRDNLKRKSLLAENGFGETYYTGEGIRNILALFNNGMDISEEKQRDMYEGHHISGYGAPYGLWETHNIRVRATTHRDPLLFMQKTASVFKTKNKKEFNIKSVTISDEYKKD